ncbi:ubiquitin carboxyl-terminal hydrolase 2 isoform X4 [Halyomorpha halys]|uniref:ubiquitin carboxyl-terminal hydrolase 2 isoform X4 n=1 Tax=Halyomorpha halys TaxID=286706 RepID=UPI0006D51E17|nr:ubiquitin carboxyl-terminal hydrolase 2-like isoform X4 [Halyomorpha halys]
MPCSAVTVDYRRDSAAMPVPITKSILEPEYSRLKFNTLSSSCSRRTSGSSPFVTELVQKYSSTRTGLGSRSSSLTDDTRDRSQTRDSSTLRSRTTSYSSESSTQSHRKPTTNYTTFDLNEFRITYAPSSYIPGSTRSELSRPPRSTESLRTRASTSILREKKSEIAEGTNLEGNISPRHFRSAANTSRKEVTASSSLSSTSNGLSGLRNIGNTCFLNSVVQCLSNTKVLKEFLINKEFMSEIRNSESRGALIKSFSEVIMELWSGEGKVVNTTAFKAQIQRYAPRFMGYNQQDAQEFLRYLLEGLHDDINRVAVKPRNLPEIDDNLSDSLKASECWKQYLRCDNSRIVDLFVGQLKSTLQCTSCGHSSTTFEVFWDLSLPLPSRSGSLRLSQCLDHFTKEEVLDGDEMPTCCKCKTRRKCTKRFSIQKFPKILVLHLKRFSPSERYRKLSATVEFPLTNLDMSGYSTTPQVATYNLYAVSNHSGTAYSGHYTAYCLHSGSGHWYEFNDSRVSSISPRSVVSSEAYILFYEQNTAVTTSRL